MCSDKFDGKINMHFYITNAVFMMQRPPATGGLPPPGPLTGLCL